MRDASVAGQSCGDGTTMGRRDNHGKTGRRDPGEEASGRCKPSQGQGNGARPDCDSTAHLDAELPRPLLKHHVDRVLRRQGVGLVWDADSVDLSFRHSLRCRRPRVPLPAHGRRGTVIERVLQRLARPHRRLEPRVRVPPARAPARAGPDAPHAVLSDVGEACRASLARRRELPLAPLAEGLRHADVCLHARLPAAGQVDAPGLGAELGRGDLEGRSGRGQSGGGEGDCEEGAAGLGKREKRVSMSMSKREKRVRSRKPCLREDRKKRVGRAEKKRTKRAEWEKNQEE